MKLKYRIYQSGTAPEGRYGPRFEYQNQIQSAPKSICRSWLRDLQVHLDQTEEIFGKLPELPWTRNEQPILGSFTSSIARRFKNSISLQELPVDKLANKYERGRCDVWVSIPKVGNYNGRFSFYIEAKAARKAMPVNQVDARLKSWVGISSLFRDLKKHQKKVVIDQRSPYHRTRIHPHYVIGMLVIPIVRESGRESFANLHEYLRENFERTHRLHLDKLNQRSVSRWRKMSRFPTTALIVLPEDGKYPGMIATLTVLASTRCLSSQKNFDKEIENTAGATG